MVFIMNGKGEKTIMSIIVREIKWNDKDKTLRFTKKKYQYEEAHSITSSEDARPEFTRAYKKYANIVKNTYSMITKEADICIRTIGIKYVKGQEGLLIAEVCSKGEVYKGDKKIKIDTGWRRIDECDKEEEVTLVELVKEAGSFILGARAQTKFKFDEEQREIEKIEIALRSEDEM